MKTAGSYFCKCMELGIKADFAYSKTLLAHSLGIAGLHCKNKMVILTLLRLTQLQLKNLMTSCQSDTDFYKFYTLETEGR